MIYPYSSIPSKIRAPRLKRLVHLAKAGVPLIQGYALDSFFLKKAAVKYRLIPDIFMRSFSERESSLRSYSLPDIPELSAFSAYKVYPLHFSFVIPPAISKKFSRAMFQGWNSYLQYAKKPRIPSFLVQEHNEHIKGYLFPYNPATRDKDSFLVIYGESVYLCAANRFCILRRFDGMKRLNQKQLEQLEDIRQRINKTIGRPLGVVFAAEGEVKVHEVHDVSSLTEQQFIPFYYKLISSTN